MADTSLPYLSPADADEFLDAETVTTGAGPVKRQRIADPNVTGDWGYAGGTSGTVNVPAGKKVLGIAAIATSSGATVTIDGGDAIPVPVNIGVEFSPRGNLVAPTIVLAGTASYLIEFVG